MLATLGFRPLKSQKDSSGVMDTLLTVLHSFQQNKIYYGDLEQRIAVLQTEHDHALANLEKKNNKLELCEREADDLRAKLSSTYSSLNEYKEEARVAKEEASTLKAGFAYYKNQYSHEIRKRDNEMQKLKQSYQKAVSSSSSSGGLKVVMINGRMPARSYKKTPENAHDDFQKLVSDEKDTRIQELTDEILQLKTCLYDIYARVKLLLSKIGSSSGSITKEQIYLPFEMIQEEIQEEMLHLIEELESVEKVLNNQTEQLDELNTVINDQQKVIKEMAELEGRGAVASKEEEESVKK
jgi:Skp family chaperone for outer membrane proteins